MFNERFLRKKNNNYFILNFTRILHEYVRNFIAQ